MATASRDLFPIGTGRRRRALQDWLRNTRGATAVASYVVRARPGAPVAAPVAWSELRDVRPGRFDVRNIFRRLQMSPDPWEGFFGVRQPIDARAPTAGEPPSLGRFST